jgi:uncharacterized protein
MPDSVYVDYDDVLCETARGLGALARRDFGWQGAFEDILNFDLGLTFRLSPRQVQRLMDMAHTPEVLLSFQPVPGALEGMRGLADEGRKVMVVTGRPPTTEGPSRAWLDGLRIPYADLLFVDKYGRGEGFKGAKRSSVVDLEDLARMKFAFAVEDAPSMLTFLLKRTRTPVVLFDRPWNATFLDEHPGYASRVKRARGWREVAAGRNSVRCGGSPHARVARDACTCGKAFQRRRA